MTSLSAPWIAQLSWSMIPR